MALRTSSTGSWPPTYDPDKPIRNLPPKEQNLKVKESIERAIQDQIALGLDVLVDGQVRDDIVSMFATQLPGYSGHRLPYRATDRIKPYAGEHGITVEDYKLAKSLAGDMPLKAHLTGPMTLAKRTRVEAGSGYDGRDDPRLVHDLAEALGQEAKLLREAGAEMIQIDEPVLAAVPDLGLAFEAMSEIIHIGEIRVAALHACGNITKILDKVLARAPVEMISIEGAWLDHDTLSHIDRGYLAQFGKRIGLGCIQVSNYHIEGETRLANYLDRMLDRLGEEHIWAVMPNCGLRPVPHAIALEKLKVMVKVAKSL